ncbi:hypothetical protein K432DRAFT_469141 [Lepidopterella palustris CBS 459.81]|uniref:Uncharacterized protein n=1 Tax=Lepidopterella palustris CBS 459.81 TaxID=1314670 RepID=A0A8E2DZS2_9PEZI|nr:hypothetical protein K432DRAFT_469141 [Lepidopterella palustris CBS 459.81]
MAENTLLACDDPTIISLFQALDNFQKNEQAKLTEKLKKERKALRREIKYYRKTWFATISLLYTGFNDLLKIRTALEQFDEQEKLANQEWLRFWKISAEPSQHIKYKLMGWV